MSANITGQTVVKNNMFSPPTFGVPSQGTIHQVPFIGMGVEGKSPRNLQSSDIAKLIDYAADSNNPNQAEKIDTFREGHSDNRDLLMEGRKIDIQNQRDSSP